MRPFALLIAFAAAVSAADLEGTIVTDIEPGKVNVATSIDCADRKYQALMTKDGLEVKSYTVANATGGLTKQSAHGSVVTDEGEKITPDKGVKAGDHAKIVREAKKP